MKIREVESLNQYSWKTPKMQLLQYRVMQNLWQRILKRSYKHNSSFICLKLEELELSWSGVRYLLKVYRSKRYFNEVSVIKMEYKNNPYGGYGEAPFIPLEQSPYCVIHCGQVIYH